MAPKQKGKSAKSAFERELNSALEKLGKSLTAISKEIMVNQHSLRQWIRRDKFPADVLVRLAGNIGFPGTVKELQAKYGMQIVAPKRTIDSMLTNPPNDISVRDAVRLIEQRLDRFDPSGRLQKHLGEDVNLFLQAMKKNDIFIFWSLDKVPYEMSDAGWSHVGPSSAQSICDGVFSIYLQPAEELLTQLRSTCGLRQLPLASFFESAFEEYVQNLRTTQVQDKETGHLKIMSDNYIREHVIRVPTTFSAFCAPAHKYVAFRSGETSRALAQFPIGSLESKNFLLPLEQDVADQFYSFVRASLRRPGPHHNFEIIQKMVPITSPSVATKNDTQDRHDVNVSRGGKK